MIDGALLLDKPVGLSSNGVLQKVKILLGARKAGHGGTLDPLASGLLLVLFGEATKFAGLLLDADKQYLATLKLGERTSTGDSEGEVLERRAVHVSPQALDQVLEKFRGAIEQVPPMHSALKRDGVALYKLARKGVEVPRERRPVQILELDVVLFEPPRLDLRVRCSKGTYIRTLAEDIGAALGSGAHLTALRRTASGRFGIGDAIGLEALEGLPPAARSDRLLPLAALVDGLPRAELDAVEESRFRQGRALPWSREGQGLWGIYRLDGGVIGIGISDGSSLRPVRLTARLTAAQA